jgi:site-specific recombinase XerC
VVWTTADPKPRKGKRTLFIGEAALEALHQHMGGFMRPEEEGTGGNDLVFTGPKGSPISDSSWNAVWVRARIDAKVHPDLHLHDLRCHAATAVAEDTKDLRHSEVPGGLDDGDAVSRRDR